MSHIQSDSRSSSPVSPDLEHQQRLPLRPHSPDGAATPLDSDDPDDPDDSDYSAEHVTPRFMQDRAAWKRWKWVPYPARRVIGTVVGWTEGPPNPRTWKINPFFPTIQRAPLRLLDRVLPKERHRLWLFFAFFGAWILTFAIVFWRGQLSSEIEGWGEPSAISCGATYWSKNNGCGIDGVDCRPFDNSSFAFRCPGNCASYRVLNPRAVGDQEISYAPLIVGGPPDPSNELDPMYRGDSFICGAAIHSGIISASQGGCGVVSLTGEQRNFVATNRHGIDSIAFDSNFPLSFTFLPSIKCEAKDARWSLLAISVVFTSVLSLFTASSAAFFFGTFVIAFFEVGLASDPPVDGPFANQFSNLLGKFLPAMFCAWVFYDKMGVRRTLRGLTAQVEKTVLWLGGCWVGALTNLTFDFIPISRLTGHDLDQQPGAKAALAVIVIVLVVIIAGQIWCFQQEARLVRYLKLYALFILAILIALALPNLSLRLHHYILALLLLPGTSIQTRLSLLYQGILVGFFINGIARWGFDPVLQTSTALQGDAQLGTALPDILAPVINTSLATIAFRWGSPPSIRYDGISILVNDVERYRGFFDDNGDNEFVWTRDNSTVMNEYFRFAYVQGTSAGDYTRAGTWNTEREWVQMPPGPSKVKGRDLIHDDEQVARALWKRH
ncbi:putative lccl domain-containing protein [Rosellinia necatrix]|uniref:Putative lccl domain-containing protein n=1 Tax=Rosellinia necatrix TaxID=77044 RepID=A0A1W2TR01_ROSNE|nr:putative lccl domain-containing protein [Rosellinia necatrix]